MGVVKGQDHTVSPITNRFAFFLFHINQKTIPEKQLFWNLTLKNQRSGFLRKSYFEIWPWKIKGQGWGQRSRSYSSPSIQPMHHLFASHPSEQPLIPEIYPIVFDLEKTHPKIWEKNFQKNSCKIYSGNKHDQRDIATKFCNDLLSGSHFIMQQSKFLLINATAVTWGEGHRKVMQYIFPDLYFLCPNI